MIYECQFELFLCFRHDDFSEDHLFISRWNKNKGLKFNSVHVSLFNPKTIFADVLVFSFGPQRGACCRLQDRVASHVSVIPKKLSKSYVLCCWDVKRYSLRLIVFLLILLNLNGFAFSYGPDTLQTADLHAVLFILHCVQGWKNISTHLSITIFSFTVLHQHCIDFFY